MRMLSKIITASAFGAIAAAAPANAGEAATQRFTHEGYTYVYDVKETKVGQIISGRRFPGSAAFNLAVKNGRVKGVSGGQSVLFSVDEARGAAQ